MLSKIHTSSTNNFFFRTVQTLWYMHCSMVTYYYRISTITCNISRNFFKMIHAENLFFLSNTCMFMQGNKRNSCVFYSHLWRELQQQSLNSCTVIHSLCTISVLWNALFLSHFSLFFHIFILVQPFSQLLKIWMP